MNITGIIPARYASSRLPGKPLLKIAGKPMIQWVYEQASKAKKLDRVIVATDDQRIMDCVKGFGGSVVMTSAEHKNGTERIAEVAQKSESDAFINIQGDEPFIAPEQIDQIAALLESGAEIATLVKQISAQEEIQDTNTVKVVRSLSGKALYFSRHPIPFYRNSSGEKVFWQHIGIYGFNKAVLAQLVQLPVSPLEKAESLEQLRWLENGYEIYTTVTNISNISIDTELDLLQAQKLLKQ
ncbi:MAG: 3-deoxy-manno-octulosonate cytidylyltransferase [Chitinophagales bacterium]